MRNQARIATGVAAAGTLLLLTACGGAEAPGAQSGDDISGKVTMWAFPLATVDDPSWYQPHIDRFNEIYPDVEIEVVVKPWKNRETMLVTAITGGTEPDVVYFNPGYVTNFAGQDLLLPLDDIRDDWSAFADSALEAGTREGTLYAAPTLVSFNTSYCNAEVLAAADIADCPTSWDDLREAAPAVKDAGYYLTEYSGTNSLNLTFFPYLWQAGGEVLNEDQTEAAFNGPEGVKALEFLKEMVDNDWVPTEPLGVEQPFEQSSVGQEHVAYVMGENLRATREVVNPDVIETVPPMKDVEQVASGSVGGWSVFNTTDVPEAAKAWVRFLGEPEFLEDLLGESGFLSPRTDITGLFSDDPQIAEGTEHLEHLRTDFPHAQATKIMNMIRPHIQSALLEDTDPQEALDAAAEEVNTALEASG
ncbi:ABC transporter substrate-binding protein [Microbacterium sp. JB110]|uniref:ABC transporter substrate-binding protein n=1 Tax=Microbacterium sp. JB110 TaxID=2024477 RepID=UPI001481E604|nr:sugar ABC transporter substrate-binding protein [Microbacterium sp. JB110]